MPDPGANNTSLFMGDDGPDAAPNLFASRRSRLLVGKRGVVASTLSTLVVVGLIVALLFVPKGGATFRYTFFDPHNLWLAWVGDPRLGLDAIRDGLVTNIEMFLISEVIVLILGVLIAWCRISQSPVLFPFRVMATAYTDVARGVPLLLVILIVGFGLPQLDFGYVSSRPPIVYGIFALVFCYAAYVSEVIRAGIFAIPNGQHQAARALGLSHASMMRHVILPQAIRNVIPPLLNDFISLQKDTALVSILGVIDVTRAAQIFSSTEFNESGLTLAAIFFLVLTIPMTRFTDRLIAKDRARRLATT